MTFFDTASGNMFFLFRLVVCMLVGGILLGLWLGLNLLPLHGGHSENAAMFWIAAMKRFMLMILFRVRFRLSVCCRDGILKNYFPNQFYPTGHYPDVLNYNFHHSPLDLFSDLKVFNVTSCLIFSLPLWGEIGLFSQFQSHLPLTSLLLMCWNTVFIFPN